MNNLKLKKTNDGFTLVELIVVIVIIAILVGVTIGGIYVWVNKARMATDLNNAEAIETTLSSLNTDMEIYNATKDTSANIYIMWGIKPLMWDETKNTFKGKYSVNHSAHTGKNEVTGEDWVGVDITDETATLICKKIAEKFPEGLPAPQTGTNFVISINTSPEGLLRLYCKAHKAKEGEKWYYNHHDADIVTEDITD